MAKELGLVTHLKVTTKGLLDSYLSSGQKASHDRQISDTLDQGANLIAKFYFVTWHTEYILRAKFGRAFVTEASHKAFPMTHFADESVTELFHSLLMAKDGLTLQAIHAQRRYLETVVFGSFFSLAQLTMKGGREINPFMLMEGTGIWPKNAGRNPIRVSELRRLRTNNQTLNDIFTNFTSFYIGNFCIPRCKRHTVDKEDVCIADIDLEFKLTCDRCAEPAETIAFSRVPTFNLMLSVVQHRLAPSTPSGMTNLYSELSNYIHPNPLGHQHGPSFELMKVRKWFRLLRSVVDCGFWIYCRTLKSIEFYDENLLRFEKERGYQLNGISLNSLRGTYCRTLMRLSHEDYTSKGAVQ